MSAEQVGQSGQSGQSGQPGRYQRSASGMVGALLVLLAVVIVFVVLRDVNRNDPADPVGRVDYVAVAEVAREEAGFDLVAPRSLPSGWQATSVDFVRGEHERWHLGMLTGEDRYVGLEQSADGIAAMVAEHVDERALRDGTIPVAGAAWQTWSDDGGDRALVRRENGTTTLLVGHQVTVDVLGRLAASLR